MASACVLCIWVWHVHLIVWYDNQKGFQGQKRKRLNYYYYSFWENKWHALVIPFHETSIIMFLSWISPHVYRDVFAISSSNHKIYLMNMDKSFKIFRTLDGHSAEVTQVYCTCAWQSIQVYCTCAWQNIVQLHLQ